jgi:hypothetical protein
VSYGPHGVEVQRDGRKDAKFTTWPTIEANWLEAVAWAREREDNRPQPEQEVEQ